MPVRQKTAIALLGVCLLAASCTDSSAPQDPTATANPNAISGGPSWVKSNLGGGGAFGSPHITIDGAYVVGSDISGAYVSLDKGESWFSVGIREGLTSTHVSATGEDPEGRLLIGTDDGLFSFEEGQASQVITGGYVTGISWGWAAIHPASDALEPNIWRTSPTGYERVAASLPNTMRVVGLRADPSDLDRLLVIGGQGREVGGPNELWYSPDGGASFVQLLADEVSDAQFDKGEIFVTTTSGLLLRVVGESSVLIANHGGVILLGDGVPALLELDEARIWRSDGSSFVPMGDTQTWGVSWAGETDNYLSSLDGDLHTVAVSSDGTEIVWTTPRFVFVSKDSGETFTPAHTRSISGSVDGAWSSTGLDNVVPIAIAPTEAATIVGLGSLGCIRSLDRAAWQLCNDLSINEPTQGYASNSIAVAADPQDETHILMLQVADFAEPLHILQSFDSGASWSVIDANLPRNASLSSLAIGNSGDVLVSRGGDVWGSTGDLLSWEPTLNCQAGCQQVWFAGGGFWAGGSLGLWFSPTGQAADWEPVSQEAFTSDEHFDWTDPSFRGVVDVAVSSNSEIYVAVSGIGLFRSRDQGATFDQIQADSFIRSVAVSPLDPHIVVTGSSSAIFDGDYSPASRGLQVSWDGGDSFHSVDVGLAYPFVFRVRPGVLGDWWLLVPGEGVVTGRLPDAPVANAS